MVILKFYFIIYIYICIVLTDLFQFLISLLKGCDMKSSSESRIVVLESTISLLV